MSGEATDGAGADGPELPARFQFSIKTFTGRYLPVEDRLRLDSVDVEGAEQCILLTRRLCNKLIPTIATQLEEKLPEGDAPRRGTGHAAVERASGEECDGD